MTKGSELIDAVAASTHMTRERVRLVLDALALHLADELGQGRRVRLPGVGILSTRETPAKEGVTGFGQPYSVPARRKVKLAVAASLARAVEVPPSA
jgi:DNA-binding protein HU-beta